MTDGQPDIDTGQRPDTRATDRRRTTADTLRYVPPVAALGTAFVLQVTLITDTVGTALAERYTGTEPWPWYTLALLLGLSVASCVEGGAAYLMDLYDRHLLAGDSVWLLRLSMLAYVAGSALAVHWWAGQRQLPEVVSWLLAGMSASALFLWSRGSRWAQRDKMRTAGQLDPAMPRLSLATKIWHPWRWLMTVRLISWEPVSTTDEARATYDRWAAERKTRRPDTKPAPTRPVTDRRPEPVPATREPDSDDHTVVPLRRTARDSNGHRPRATRLPSIAELVETLAAKHGQDRVGLPTALSTLRARYGSCSKERAIEAKNLHNARREQVAKADTSAADTDDPEERDQSAPSRTGATA